jgi:hypothetical protein|tara:strand:- start:311 stop:1015 length:705 start_codon:yes stop_codon:yes gene_type:complete
MIEETDIETYLYLSKDKFKIYVFDKKKQKNLFKDELKVDHEFNFQDLYDLSKFLDKNVYKIERLTANFIKNIILIVDYDKNFNMKISTKKKNYENFIKKNYLYNSLIELKDLFKQYYQDQKIMHMIIDNYVVNGKKYSSLENNQNIQQLCLEVNFISISNDLVFILEKLMEKYQITISKYMCGNYIKNYLDEDNIDLSLITFKLKNGMNDNEVILVPKNIENRGFFEKFFQLFS